MTTQVKGPLPGPVPTPAYAYDLAALGYVEQEFLLEGTAESYELVGERSSDGRWQAKPAATAPYTTRVLVRRPVDPARFSGTVVVEWLNVSGGLDAGPDWSLLHRHLIRRGHAWVGVSAQKAGIDGGGFVEGMHLKKVDPARYGALAHPGDAWSYDIFSQAGRGLREGSAPSLLGPLTARRLLAIGESQSAIFLVTYLNAVDSRARVYDGFLVHGRGGVGAGFDGFRLTALSEIADGARAMSQSGERIRDDVRVPVLVLQSETDVAFLGGGRARQPDGERLRLWEIAGAAHADTYLLVASGFDDGRLSAERRAELLRPTSEVLGLPTGSPINAGPQQHYVGHAALEQLERWAGGGAAPPSAARLSASDDGASFCVDAHGIATGGLRTPWVDVPLVTLSGLGQTGAVFSMLFGTTKPLAEGALAALYPGGRDDYLARFRKALEATLQAGYLLAEDRNEILALAAASFPKPASDPK